MGRSLSRSSAGSLPREGNEKATSTSHTLEEVETMVHCIISLYESKVSAHLRTIPFYLRTNMLTFRCDTRFHKRNFHYF